MNNLDINRAYKFCKLLKVDCIKQEIDEKTKGYNLEQMELKNGEWTIVFRKKNGDCIVHTTSFDSVDLMEFKNNSIEKIVINGDLLLTSRSIEKRKNGIVYSVLQKQFMPSSRFKNEIVLTDLSEQRYVFTKNNLESLINNFDFDNYRLSLFLLKILKIERNYNLKEICDLYNEFSTHMNNYYSNWDGSRKIKNNIYPSKTYLNGRDISTLYDIDGPNKLYRIFDLYKGIINPRNERDLNSISKGFINESAYDLMTLEGIKEKEDSLVGKSSKTLDNDYYEYLKEMLFKNFGYKGPLELSRDSILEGITCQMTDYARVKKVVEQKLGITYNEFQKLDVYEQRKLIEEKTGEKVKIDYRLRIDRIPIDEDHIITREKVDKRIDEITESGSKSALSRLLRPFKKR